MIRAGMRDVGLLSTEAPVEVQRRELSSEADPAEDTAAAAVSQLALVATEKLRDAGVPRHTGVLLAPRELRAGGLEVKHGQNELCLLCTKKVAAD
jgi:hypothetical protein